MTWGLCTPYLQFCVWVKSLVEAEPVFLLQEGVRQGPKQVLHSHHRGAKLFPSVLPFWGHSRTPSGRIQATAVCVTLSSRAETTLCVGFPTGREGGFSSGRGILAKDLPHSGSALLLRKPPHCFMQSTKPLLPRH